MVNIMQQKPLQRFKNILKHHSGSSQSWEDFADKIPPSQSCEGPSVHVPMMSVENQGSDCIVKSKAVTQRELWALGCAGSLPKAETSNSIYLLTWYLSE